MYLFRAVSVIDSLTGWQFKLSALLLVTASLC